ncbi:MAG TPA: SH3 domain-containing protein [Pseudomonadales bacterium]|nr:SH3 domain-containing protein [Pseudomonadales bacterium]
MMHKNSGRLLLGSLLLSSALLVMADPGQTTVATELKSTPDASGSTVSQLPAGQAVQIGERKGAWYQVKTSQGEGWVRMLNVRLQSGAARSGDSTMSGLAALGQATRSNTTVATGVRGLSRKNLQQAQEDPAEVAKLNQYQVSADEARKFGQAGGLPAPRN